MNLKGDLKGRSNIRKEKKRKEKTFKESIPDCRDVERNRSAHRLAAMALRRKDETVLRIYVIGPVTGFDDLNVTAFENARRKLREAGFMPLIPHDFVSEDADWQQAMRRSVETLAKADGIAYIDGWQKSKGARIEWRLAHSLGIEIASVDSWCACESKKIAVMNRIRKRKFCPRCKHVLPVELFDSSSSSSDEQQGYCRECMVEYKQERRTGSESA